MKKIYAIINDEDTNNLVEVYAFDNKEDAERVFKQEGFSEDTHFIAEHDIED